MWRKVLIVSSGILACTYALWVVGFVAQTPDIGIHCSFTPVIQDVDRSFLDDIPADQCPKPGDTILRIGPQEIGQGSYVWAQVLLTRALLMLPQNSSDFFDAEGRRVEISFQRHGTDQVVTTWLPLRSIPSTELIPSILWFLLKFGLFMVGALVLWNRPEDDSASKFFVLCLVTLGAYMGGYHWMRIATQPGLILIFMICGILLPAVSLHFYLVFPRPKQFLQRHGRRVLMAIYGPPLAFLLAIVVCYLRVRSPGTEIEHAAEWQTLRFVVGMYLRLAMAWYVFCVACLIHSYWTAVDAGERNQVKWILYGSMGALVPIGYSLYLVVFDPDSFGAGAATWPMFFASVCFTVAFGVSITRYRLMQLDQLVSSGAVYFLISVLVGLVYFAVVFGGMLLVGSQVLAEPLLTQALAVSGTILFLLLVLDIVRGRVKKALDRRFFREKHQLDRTLRRMSQAIEQLVDQPTLGRRLLHTSAELLGVSRGAVYLREGNPPIYRLAGSLGWTPPLQELPPGCPLIEGLERHGALKTFPGSRHSVDPALRQLQFLGGEMAHGLMHEGQMLALIVLGHKDVGLYSTEDMNILEAFSQFTALALESAAGHNKIESLNRELRDKVDKISEQQRRILALQTQLMRQSTVADVPADESPKQPDQQFGILGSSLPVRHLLGLVRKVSTTQSSVLIRGESGTGKELFAKALYENSPRAGKPFVKVHCAALSPSLLESELFGHVKGAFTGAHRDKVGRFELANNGTLFLDEIGDINLEVQTKLLRVIQERTFERVGSSDPVQVDVRIFAATHQNLEELIRQGRFREDLYYRLKVIDITVPSLRERIEDIPELCARFLRVYAERCNKPIQHIDDDVIVALKSYTWPGNIRELENVIERAVVVAEGPVITLAELPSDLLESTHRRSMPTTAVIEETSPGNGFWLDREGFERRERERFVHALAAASGNKAKAARALGLARSTFLSRLKRHGLS